MGAATYTVVQFSTYLLRESICYLPCHQVMSSESSDLRRLGCRQKQVKVQTPDKEECLWAARGHALLPTAELPQTKKKFYSRFNLVNLERNSSHECMSTAAAYKRLLAPTGRLRLQSPHTFPVQILVLTLNIHRTLKLGKARVVYYQSSFDEIFDCLIACPVSKNAFHYTAQRSCMT